MSTEGLTYDTGALVAAERDDRLVWSLHRAALARGLPPTVPAGVLAEGWRGGPQATLSRFLKGCHVEDLSEASARAVGCWQRAPSMTTSLTCPWSKALHGAVTPLSPLTRLTYARWPLSLEPTSSSTWFEHHGLARADSDGRFKPGPGGIGPSRVQNVFSALPENR